MTAIPHDPTAPHEPRRSSTDDGLRPLLISIDPTAVPVLHLTGRLDQTTASQMRAVTAQLLLNDPSELVIDCQGLE